MQRLASRALTSSRLLLLPGSLLGRGGNRRPLLTSSTAKRYEVFCILPDGRVDTLRVSKADLLAECNIYMRDLLQLGLDVPFALRHVQRMPPFVEARGDCVLLLLGPFKAIVLREKAYVFNPERSPVRTAVHCLKDELATRHATITRNEELPHAQQQQQQQREGTGATPAFELVVMEHLLDELCGAYQRRMRLFHPIVARLLLGLTHGSESDAMEGLHRLVPITNGISNFAMVIDESVECLEFLLKDDDHLRGLLLSAKHQGQLQNTPPESPSTGANNTASSAVVAGAAADFNHDNLLPDNLRAGCRVELHSLVSQPQRNGATGTVVSNGSNNAGQSNTVRPRNEEHRFEVLLDGVPRVKVAIKASNLRLLFDTAGTLDGSASARAAEATKVAESHAMVTAAAAKETLEAAQQEDVELMIEAHHRRLSLIRTQVSQLMRSVKTTQEVTSIRIDVSRNRIIRTNLHLTIASVSIGVMTAMAGFLGMNLELPMWVDGGFTSGAAAAGSGGEGIGTGSGPFLTAVAVSAGLGGAVYGFGLAHASGALRRLTAVPSDVEDVVALGRIFEDMSSIEHAVHAHMGGGPNNGRGGVGDGERQGEMHVDEDGMLIQKNEERNGEAARGLNKDEFRALLADDTKRDVSSRELELIYEVFDVSGDGLLRNEEVAKVQAEHAFRRHLRK